MPNHPGHVVCIIGGAVAGSEAAFQLAERGIYSVVIEMEALPWGKIELGLPKWHARQRDMEERGIDEKITNPYVTYVPKTKLGRDVFIDELLEWDFSAILLASGAWKDRPLGIEGIDDFEGKGFYYQNPFVAWFNQYHSPRYDGPQMQIRDDAIVIGGGLASLDVVKILMLETTLTALRKRGIEGDLFEMEKKGIPKTLEKLGVEWEDLGIKGCTLYYRRQAKDMPLIPLEDNPSPERIEKAEKVRTKLLENFLRKYLFHFVPCRVARDKIVEDSNLKGLVLQSTEIVDGRVLLLPDTEEEVRSPLVISSIGSIPEPIPGMAFQGELLKISDYETGKLEDYENVFALGNAVTGRGNIQASRVHGRQVSEYVMDEFLKWRVEDYEKVVEAIQEKTGEVVENIASQLNGRALKNRDEIDRIHERARVYQEKVGYSGNYEEWLEEYRPVRLEEIITSQGKEVKA